MTAPTCAPAHWRSHGLFCLEPCFRRVICRGVKEGKPPALTAQVAFLLFAKRGEVWYTVLGSEMRRGLRSNTWRDIPAFNKCGQ